MRNRRLSWTRASKAGIRARKPGAKLKQALCAAGVNLAAFVMFAIYASFKAREMFGIFAMFAGRVILAAFAAWVIFAVIAGFPRGELFGTIEPDAQHVGFWFSGKGLCFMWPDLFVSLWWLPCAFPLPALRVLLMFFFGAFWLFRIELSSCAGCDTTNFNH